MLAFFPGILYLALFSPTLLRLGSGIAFIYAGYTILMRREKFEESRFPLVGHPASWMIWFSGIVTALDGFAILMGYGTQLAAIIGMLIALKHLVFLGKYESLRPLSRGTYALLIVICLSLLITGAGRLGLDLPL